MFAKRLAAAVSLMVCIVGTAVAQDIPLVLRVAGETAGPPVRFDVLIGDTVVGSSTIEGAGPISAGEAAAAQVSDFSYYIPARALGFGQPIRVVLTRAPNDTGDTDLFVAGAILGGRSIDPAEMGLEDEAGIPLSNPLVAGMVVVFGKRWSVSIPIPPALATAEAVASTDVTNVKADLGNSQTSEVEDASCTVAATINLTAFQHGSANLEGEGKAQIVELARTLDGQVCAVAVTGYASSRGDADVNAEIARRRAATVYAEMESLNIDLTRAIQRGAGETVQFGPGDADNRRVVVEIMP